MIARERNLGYASLNRQQSSLFPPLNPEKRAKAIRDALAKRKIKPTSVIGDILKILDQIALEEKKSA